MKVVLIDPPVNLDKTVGKFKKIASASLPLGLGYVSAMLKKDKIDTTIIDGYAEQLTIDETVNQIIESRVNIVGISCVTPNTPYAHELSRKLKEKNKEIIVVFGGVHPTLMTGDVLKDDNVDFVVRYEGEKTFLNLVKSIIEKEPVDSIKGVSFRRNGEIVHNEKESFIYDLDSIPFPAWDKFKLEFYHPLPHWALTSWAKPLFPILGSRGCPFSCTYCSVETLGRKNRVRSAENICDEIEWLIKDFKAEQIIFWDAIFPFSKAKGIVLFEEMIKRNINKSISWECETKVNVVDEELLRLMKRAGCKRVIYGIESGVQELLNNINKKITISQIEKAVMASKKAGIETMANFMLGLPGESVELSRQTIEFAKKINPDFVKFNLTIPYPGSKIFSEGVKDGSVKSTNWEQYTSLNALETLEPVYVPKAMTKEELVSIQKKAMLEFYLRPKVIFHHIKKIRSFEDIKRYWKTFVAIIS